MSREEIVAAIKKFAQELGRCPKRREVLKELQISHRQLRKLFGTYSRAVQASGMESRRTPTTMEALFLDWAGVVRKLMKLPSIFEYEGESAYSSKPLISRFKGWRAVAPTMLAYIEREGLEEEWRDVAEAIRAERRVTPTVRPTNGPPGTGKILTDRPTFGPPLTESGMLCGPENENGVLFLFGMRAWQLGFAVKKIQQAFLDIIALRKIDEQTWQEVRIEAEQESRNFLRHGHPLNGCDLIVCWIHNWPECPIEVLELSTVEW
ncbi:MAG TPA: hypothetical protein VKL99_05260 [Candidatus Angelobacter sp.]|nr:hypothetical protein [Candidatus Angelobacter sp.]